MEIASARPIERFSHTQQLDNSCHFGAAATLLQFTTGTGTDRPSCMFSFDMNMNSSNSNVSLSPSTLKSPKLLKENAITLSNFTCKRRLDFNHLTLANSYHQQNDIANNNNNVSINNNDVNTTNENHPSHRDHQSSRHHHHHHHQQGQGSHQRHSHHQNQTKPLTTAVQRRNERERNRVKLINMTFATLRQHLPNGTKGSRSKKMSKVETLKAAIDYIRYLKQLVDEHDAVNTVFDPSVLSTAPSLSPNTSLSSPIPSPSSCSNSSCDGLSVDEEDLLDFSNWF